MTFYLDPPQWDTRPRFGDVIIGAVLSAPNFDLDSDPPSRFRLKVQQPDYAAILTPCCSIESNTVLLAPLEQIPKNWLKYSHWNNEFTIINDPQLAEKALGTKKWKELGVKRKTELLQQGLSYIQDAHFVYAPSDNLPSYTFTYKDQDYQLSHYYIDFKNIFRIESSAFKRDEPLPMGTKKLQLSIETRNSLRSKLVHYFKRQAREDQSAK